MTLLLAHGHPLNGDHPPLELAVRQDLLPRIQTLLRMGADPNARYQERPMLCVALATESRNAEAMKLLLDAGADPNALDDSGSFAATALMYAAAMWTNPADEVMVGKIEALLKAGADPEVALPLDGNDPTQQSCAEDLLKGPMKPLFKGLLAAQKARALEAAWHTPTATRATPRL